MTRINLIKIVIGVVIVAILGTGVSLAAGIWDPLWNPFRPEPEEVIEKMIREMERLKTGSSQIDFSIKGENEGKFQFDFKIKGDTDNTQPENPKFNGSFEVLLSATEEESLMGGKFVIGGEVKTIGQASYLKFTTLPAIPFLELYLGSDLSQVKDQWIKVDSESIINLAKKVAGEEWTPEMEKMYEESLGGQKIIQEEIQKKFKEVLTGRKLYLVEEELPDQKIGENKVYHYLISLNKEEIKRLIPEIWKGLEEIMLKEYGMAPTFEEEKFKEELGKFLDKIGEIRGEVWIGKKDNLLYSLKGEKEIDISQLTEGKEEGKLNLSLGINNSKFNQVFEIKEPEEFNTIDEVFERIFSQYLETNESSY